MYDQLPPMRQLVQQLKKDKDGANKKISATQKEMDTLITRFKVNPCHFEYKLIVTYL